MRKIGQTVKEYGSAEVSPNEYTRPHESSIPSDKFEQAHHMLPSYIPRAIKKVGIYSNYGLSAQDTVDFSLLSDLVNIQMGPAITGEMLKTSGTLGGLMAAIGIMGMAPSLHSLLFCISILAIDMSVSSPVFLASGINRKNFYTTLDKSGDTLRFLKLRPNDNITSFEVNAIKSMLNAVLIALVLFDDAVQKRKPGDTTNVDLYSLQINCINYTHALTIAQPTGTASHIASYAGRMCSVIFSLHNCSGSQNGQGSHGIYFQQYTNRIDYRIHNNLLSRLLGYGNSFSTLVARMIFSTVYSPQSLHVKMARGQRQTALTNKNVKFSRYLFDNTAYDETSFNVGRYISFDTIDLIIRNKMLPLNNQDQRYNDIYDNLVGIARQTQQLVGQITSLRKSCTIEENAVSQQDANSFQSSIPVADLTTLNPLVFKDSYYNGLQLLNYTETHDKYQFRILLNMLGNRVSLGMRYVAWYMHNLNYVTEDYYYRFASIDETLKKSTDIADIMNVTPPSSYGTAIDLDNIGKVLNQATPVDQAEKDKMDSQRQSINGLVDFTQNISTFLKSLQVRTTQTKL